jgi:hypothetical protein
MGKPKKRLPRAAVAIRNLVLPFVVLGLAAGCASSVRCETSGSADCIKVLFLGNSYTYENNLPDVLSRLAESGGHWLETGISAKGGWTLMNHANAPDTEDLIRGNDWSYVVLQEQSEIPVVGDSRSASMYPAVKKLVGWIREAHAVPLLFETWAHKDGMPEYGLMDYRTMQSVIGTGYGTIGRELNIAISPVGEAWRLTRERYPGIELWQSDGSHPNRNGTYLAACVFYAVLYKESPEGLAYTFQIPVETASILQQMAKEVVMGISFQPRRPVLSG